MCATPGISDSSRENPNTASDIPSSDVPSAPSTTTWNVLASSFGMNDRPTIRLSGTVLASTSTATPTTSRGWDIAHRSERVYPVSIHTNNRFSLVLGSSIAGFSHRALSIGVSVKLTRSDTMMANAIVHPKGDTNWRA